MKIKKTETEKNKKKVYSVTLSENVVNHFNKKIGYCSRSKAIEDLIIQNLKNNSQAHKIGPTKGKDSSRKGGLNAV